MEIPDVEIFADRACTTKPTGETDIVYARINKPWVGLNSGWVVESPNEGSVINCIGPNDVDDWYYIELWIDFNSDVQYVPYTSGEVVRLTTMNNVDVTGFDTEFFKPE